MRESANKGVLVASELREYRLNGAELDYLTELAKTDEVVANVLKMAEGRSLRMDRATSEKLRVRLNDRLVRFGFEADYSLTEEGRRIEDLIDKFFFP